MNYLYSLRTIKRGDRLFFLFNNKEVSIKPMSLIEKLMWLVSKDMVKRRAEKNLLKTILLPKFKLVNKGGK